MLGKPVVQELAAAGFEVTALVRHPDQAREVLPPAVKLVQRDLTNTDQLVQQLQGHDFLYISLAVATKSNERDFQPERDGLQNLLTAARQAGIRRVGYLSSLIMEYNGFDWWVFNLKRAAAKTIASSGIPYVLFRPTAFMETLRDRQTQGTKVLGAGKSLHKLYWIAGSDYGKQVAAAFQRIPDGESRDYIIQGTEPLDQHEAVAVYAKHYGKGPLTVSWAPLGLLKFIGLFNKELGYGSKIIQALNNNPEAFQASGTWEELGKPTVTLREFAAAVK